MDDVPAYELVFLNELHDRLKLLNPWYTTSAGLFRVLGRLSTYDLDNQVVIVESCFHHQHTPLRTTEAAMITTTVEANGNRPKTPFGLGSSTEDPVQPIKSCTIDLTLGDEEEGKEGGDGSEDSESTAVNNSGYIDLTCTTDDESCNGDENDSNSDALTSFIAVSQVCENKEKGAGKRKLLSSSVFPSLTGSPPQPRRRCSEQQKMRAPKVALWVSTELLSPGQWRFEPGVIFQFIGEIEYRSGHWVLVARACRNMEGLDLYTYRESILLTRKLMQRMARRGSDSDHEYQCRYAAHH
ncbi:hypothetical protein BCR41DRAFT_359368 [Lobosporangium transversale]|uniref:Uncharacterized protein n=1 Tax=Lobosporangium transversale TaxID=64571 RepID=A0A1Y2GEF5_9FUNG|nr:hypothetical protein BCR41DRAFT_359368 [Lobosporangium transversale]ORZ08536.1 hypothetical protein BCR41DRAFT_359368 [Lobosporangium transversale]|eukprot:XP_021878464.1 hypothetical protein BCR41DRAFT_359368 [Lobosporangium transversale]